MEAGEVQGVVGELVTFELDKFTVPLLGELPNDGAWHFHFPKDTVNSIFINKVPLPLL